MNTQEPPPLADLVTEVRRLATERPNYVYRAPGEIPGTIVRCANVHRRGDGSIIPNEGCIIGQAMTNLGYGWSAVTSTDTSPVAFFYVPMTAPDSVRLDWLIEVQSEQDRTVSWGRAVAAADYAYPSVT